MRLRPPDASSRHDLNENRFRRKENEMGRPINEDYADEKCGRCGHARGDHDESECMGGEDVLCSCDSFEEPEDPGDDDQ